MAFSVFGKKNGTEAEQTERNFFVPELKEFVLGLNFLSICLVLIFVLLLYFVDEDKEIEVFRFGVYM